MEWWVTLIILFGSLMFLFAIGMPVAFSFLLIDLIGVFVFWRGEIGLSQFILNVHDSVANFNFLPVPLFVLMGDFMFRSGMASNMMDALEKWIGRIPGRLSILAVFGGAVFGALSGAGVASAAMLGSVLLPEMEQRGYKKAMTLGPLLASAGLDILIPPSALGVILAIWGQLSIGKFLVAITVPGILLAFIYVLYIVIRCSLQPHLAPSYEIRKVPLSEKIKLTLLYVLPLGTVFFLAIGVIFLGVATPTEAAAMGSVGCVLLAVVYRDFSWKVFKESVYGTVQVSVMIFMIFAGSTVFAQILAYTGSTKGLAELAVNSQLHPIVVLVLMQLICLIMGFFMDPVAVIMVTIPIFMPIIKSFGFDPLWFGVIILLNMQMATISPPFGTLLFVMKSVAPRHVTMADIYTAVYPFLALDLLAMAIMIAYPPLLLWLPGLMK
jgi:tripartite ATP-independent transporter DctM subunit